MGRRAHDANPHTSRICRDVAALAARISSMIRIALGCWLCVLEEECMSWVLLSCSPLSRAGASLLLLYTVSHKNLRSTQKIKRMRGPFGQSRCRGSGSGPGRSCSCRSRICFCRRWRLWPIYQPAVSQRGSNQPFPFYFTRKGGKRIESCSVKRTHANANAAHSRAPRPLPRSL